MAQPFVLPVIDVSRFRDPSTDRGAYLAELRDAAHEVGWVDPYGDTLFKEQGAQVARREAAALAQGCAPGTVSRARPVLRAAQRG